uniref:DNA helicase Pif1-like 2B domain-containing protein n=1 Tax=Brassica oleracea var. oleracea TaxID=109376 RepID=A0A0D3BVT0_BRAOL
MEDVKINLLLAVHDELQKLKHVMMNEFKRLRQVMSPPVEITKAVKINGDEGLAVLGCSSFASSSRNNELFKETIDVSNDEALIAQFWISNVAHKTHWHANSAPSRPNQSHEPFTPTPKKLSQEEPVSGKPPPLHDKEVVLVQSYVAMEKKHNIIIKASHVVSNLEDKSLGPINDSQAITISESPDNKLEKKIVLDKLMQHQQKKSLQNCLNLIRNIDPTGGLMNGTRLQITEMYDYMIKVKVIIGDKIGRIVLIPRLAITPSDKKLPFKMRRRQLPIAVAFAITINKSHGQSLS